jgi:hypothetical protein
MIGAVREIEENQKKNEVGSREYRKYGSLGGVQPKTREISSREINGYNQQLLRHSLYRKKAYDPGKTMLLYYPLWIKL